MIRTMRLLAGSLALAAFTTACDADDPITGPANTLSTRTFSQVERLGNPLVSEVFFLKRDHGLHNTKSPSDDPVSLAQGGVDAANKIKAFIAQFGRSQTIQNTVSAVLTPDMLLVYPNRAGNTAGWLSWALANGYGGRKLSDDVVDAGLSAVFGTLVDPNAGTVSGLTSDNVPANDKAFSTTFPYLAAPTP